MPKRKAHASPSSDDPPSDDSKDNDPSTSDSGKSSKDDTDASTSDFPSEVDQDQSSSDEGDEGDEGDAYDRIDVNFEFFDPQEKDFHGIRTLLTNFLDGKKWACSNLVEAVLASSAATVIKCGEDEEAIGVAAVLPLLQQQKVDADADAGGGEGLADIFDFLAEHCPPAQRHALASSWTAPGAAFLLAERLLNCPPQLAPPLMEGLMEECKGHMEATSFIVLARAYVDPLGDRPNSSDAFAVSKSDVDGLVFTTPEGEFLCRASKWAFAFPIANRPIGKDDLVPYRVAAAVAGESVAGTLRDMARVVGVGGSS